MESCLEVAFCLPGVLHFGDLNNRLVIHLEPSTSISKLALQVFSTFYQTETQPRLKLPGVCVLSGPHCSRAPIQH